MKEENKVRHTNKPWFETQLCQGLRGVKPSSDIIKEASTSWAREVSTCVCTMPSKNMNEPTFKCTKITLSIFGRKKRKNIG